MRDHFRLFTLAVVVAAGIAAPVTGAGAATPVKSDTLGFFHPVDRTARLRTSLSAGPPDVLPYVIGVSGDVPVVGDWNGDGVDGTGYYRNGDHTFHLREVLDATGPSDYAFVADFALAGDVPVIGDWDGDGRDGIGTYRPSDLTFRLRNVRSGGQADYQFASGAAGDKPVAGDWNGDGKDSVGLFRPGTGNFHLRNALNPGASDYAFDHPRVDAGDLPVVGDWNGDGIDTAGAWKNSSRTFTALAANNATAGVVASYVTGSGGDQPLAGDWKLDVADPDPAQLARVYGFYADPAGHATQWAAANGGDARAGPIRQSIAGRPGASWFGNWSGDIDDAVDAYVSAAAAVHQVPMLVAYNIPDRDCGGASGGGAGSPAAYREWIDDFAAGGGDRPALVIIEPDSLAQAYPGCIPDGAKLQTRFDLISYAINAFGGRAWTYADGGNANWWSAQEMSARLTRGGVANAHGVAINVSNFYTTAQSTTYGDAIRAGVGKPYLIDTSRNGAGGTPGDWCNPDSARLGSSSKAGTAGAEFLVWVKVAGDSDGPCGIGAGIPAGTFSPALAVHLINGS